MLGCRSSEHFVLYQVGFSQEDGDVDNIGEFYQEWIVIDGLIDSGQLISLLWN